MEEYGLSRRGHEYSDECDEAQGQGVHDIEVRKGPWTVEEDSLLFNYVSAHGEGRWNSLARHAGLKRTGKSCRLRWLNYLRPNVRRGNITLQEQLLILELHSRWGNRWSKIAQCLPGRTDNEIKNYWRTRVLKQAKQLNCDVTSTQFQHALRHLWIPRLIERIQSGQPDSFHPTQINESSISSSCSSGTLNPISGPDMSASPSDALEEVPTSHPIEYNWADNCGSGQSSSWGDDYMFLNGNGGDSLENWWSEEDLSFFQHHLLD